MTVDLSQPPAKPICWNVTRSGPCEFWRRCKESRQRIQAGIRKGKDGAEVVIEAEAMRGEACVWFQQLTELKAKGALAPLPRPEEATP